MALRATTGHGNRFPEPPCGAIPTPVEASHGATAEMSSFRRVSSGGERFLDRLGMTGGVAASAVEERIDRIGKAPSLRSVIASTCLPSAISPDPTKGPRSRLHTLGPAI
jgi:hypothetical protein